MLESGKLTLGAMLRSAETLTGGIGYAKNLSYPSFGEQEVPAGISHFGLIC